MSNDLAVQANDLVTQAQAIKVVDLASCQEAGAMRKVLKEMENTIVAHYKPLKQAADKAKKVILDQEKADLGPVQLAYETLSKSLTDFLNDEEEKRKTAEAAAIREAEAKAEKEREALLKKAANAKTEEKQEELLERAEQVYAEPVAVAHAVAGPIAGVTRRKDEVVTIVDQKTFLGGMLSSHYPALVGMIEIKVGPLKAFVKANGLKEFPGLRIEEKYV